MRNRLGKIYMLMTANAILPCRTRGRGAGMKSQPLVQAHALTKRYGAGTTAVADLDLTIHTGEVYGFLGRNGAGKTTTLRMLVGLIRPTDGSASVLGQPPGSPSALARLGAL